MGMGRNGRTDFPMGWTKRSPPLSWTVFSLGCSLTGHNWAAPLLIDQTPIQRLLILPLLLIRGNVHPNPGHIHNNSRPRYPCFICHLDVGRGSLQCSTCLKWVHFHCSSLTRADFRTICATGTAVIWRCSACCPQSQTGSHTQTNSPVTTPAFPPPPPLGFPPLPPGFYQPRPPQGPPRYVCSLSCHEVGKDSLKCSTCSKWVHFSCFSLTQGYFRKICAAGSTMGWNCAVCLNGDLTSPIHQQASPAPSLQFCPLPFPHPPPPTCLHVVDSSIPLPSHPPLLNTYPLSAFTLPSTPPPPTSTQPTNNSPPHPQRTPHPFKTLEFFNGMPVVFPPHVVLN